MTWRKEGAEIVEEKKKRRGKKPLRRENVRGLKKGAGFLKLKYIRNLF